MPPEQQLGRGNPTTNSAAVASSPAAEDDSWLQKRLRTPTFRPPIFLSYSTPISPQQFSTIESLYKLLSGYELTPRTMGVNEYDFKAPLKAIRRLMNQSQGLLAVAFRKTAVHQGSTIRRRGHDQPEEQELAGQSLTSPWVQIEAAMAFQLDLPIMLIREEGVVADGLLEPGVIVHNMPVIDFRQGATSSFKDKDFKAALSSWAIEVRSSAPGWTVLRDRS